VAFALSISIAVIIDWQPIFLPLRQDMCALFIVIENSSDNPLASPSPSKKSITSLIFLLSSLHSEDGQDF
jgi:hypothetical protein